MPDLSVLILAGGPSQNDLAVSVGRAVPVLPLAADATVLDGWCRALSRAIGGVGDVDLVSIAVISSVDLAPSSSVFEGRCFKELRYVQELRQHRGTAGVVADQILQESDSHDGMILVVEASASPLVDLARMLGKASQRSDGLHACLLGKSGLGRYCGVCLCDRASFSLVPEVGFFDLKEQFLPLLRSKGRRIESLKIAPRALRLRTRAEWLAIVEAWSRWYQDDRQVGASDPEAALPIGHRQDGVCVIEPGSRIGGAVISSSIIMAGAVVEPRAIVARSVIGPGAVVASGSVVVDAVVPAGARVQARRWDSSSFQWQREVAAIWGS